jgi:hypothetical protein
MDYAISIFVLGLIVSFMVAKGVMMSHELAKTELERQQEEDGE